MPQPGHKLWGGRFEDGPDPLFRAINDSLPVDWVLARHDIAGSIAWAEAIAGAGVLTDAERDDLVAGLGRVWEKARDIHEPPVESGAEDIHTWVEAELTADLGDLGKKLHTGRSRNDQVATDFRLWAKESIAERLSELNALRGALQSLAERSEGVVMPAYTHLQPAQPVLAGHWCLAYDAMLSRDAKRLANSLDGADVCPLGSAALSGTTFPVDRDAIARRLGFARVSTNSLDAVSDRDFCLDMLSAGAFIGVHLSRISEELVVYATPGFGLIALEDAVTSGSSLMPQKKNPDALELVRGKSGGLLAAFQSLAVTLKGLPLAYNKDLQEDKPVVFAAMAELSLCLRAATRVIEAVSFVPERCREAALQGGSAATELADHLVERGVPFRDAHHIVGRVVKNAEQQGVQLQDLTASDLKAIDGHFGDNAPDCMKLEAMLARRDIPGGTAPAQVAAALQAARSECRALILPEVPDIVRDPSSVLR
ncbi:MAG: argininosuccinate lyase [Planctomycetota bacterium]